MSAANANANAASTEDKYSKFEGDGVTFRAKLIGSELVMEPRGDKMCQNSIQRLKAIIKGQKAHKQRIVMKISYAGVKVYDEKTNEILYHHEVPQISFIASDDTDSRAFGYVCDVPNKAHRFICFKTSGPALQVMSEISSLFDAVLEKKKKKMMLNDSSQSNSVSAELNNSSSSGNSSSNNNNNNSNATNNNNVNYHDSDIGIDVLGDLSLSGGDGAGAGAGAVADLGVLLDGASRPAPSEAIVIKSAVPKTRAPATAPTTPSSFKSELEQLKDLQIGASNTNVSFNFNTGSSSNLNSAISSNNTISSKFDELAYTPHNHNHQPRRQQQQQESTDKYAVFNDIDALPSIFESISSLDSASKLSNSGQQLHPGSQSMDNRRHQAGHRPQVPRLGVPAHSASYNQLYPQSGSGSSVGGLPRQMTNPFDDDFFA
jgi:hypothetical protein